MIGGWYLPGDTRLATNMVHLPGDTRLASRGMFRVL